MNEKNEKSQMKIKKTSHSHKKNRHAIHSLSKASQRPKTNKLEDNNKKGKNKK